MVVALILAGGSGERFWPKSRKKSPKHLLKIYGKKSLLTRTVERLEGLVGLEHIWVVTNQEQADLIKEAWKKDAVRDSRKIRKGGCLKKVASRRVHILIEPEARDTAAAIGLAALKMKKIYGPETIMLVVSADHWIGKTKDFKESLRRGIDLCRQEKGLVTVGVRAVRPEVGFGYIEKGRSHPAIPRVFKVKRFIEKPGLARAKKISRSSRYLWNSGIFVWKIEEILTAFKKYLPAGFKYLSQIEKGSGQPNKEKSILGIYRRVKKVSIDYGIMEKAENVWVVDGKFLWEDVGSWVAWSGLQKKGVSGNVLLGEVIPIKVKNSIVWSDKRLVAALGINNLIIVAEKDAVLVCGKEHSQEIKKIVARFRQKKKWQKYL